MTMILDRIPTASFSDDLRRSRRRSLWTSVGTGAGTIVVAWLNWLERARERRELLALDDRALQDFGASRADAAREGDKPFWRA
jgi:uncharacterized protein YjiS (DUF1127 family)